MSNLIVIGTQWGDEGKGKIVDLLSSEADTIVRFQGGHNAGHTLVVGDKIFKLSLLPSGIIRENKIAVIGNGVVLDPWKLLEEIEQLSSRGIKIGSERLIISENTPLILPFHKDLDLLREKRAGKEKIGTTGRGIGPAYEDKVGRRALRTGDLQNADEIKRKLKNMKVHHDILRAGLGAPDINEEQLFHELTQVGEKIKTFIKPAWKILNQQIKKNQNILFEGAQGSMLDVDFGTYPFVTSSSTIAAAAAIGSGVAHNKIKSVLGITKAYTTRVGEGPMPTELTDNIGRYLAVEGNEKGTVTGRDRRCGWFDAPLVKRSCILNGVTSLALTKIDVLDKLETIKICTGYRVDKDELPDFPVTTSLTKKLMPIYEEIDGWNTSTVGLEKMSELPLNARIYIQRIEELTESKVSIISTGPERNQTITINSPFQSN
ncbi:MAG: adenylosuccinate synthase [Rhodobacteraceae bacterium]|nr:adenylosuccinate synthase [Paracoccaceae bacterium]